MSGLKERREVGCRMHRERQSRGRALRNKVSPQSSGPGLGQSFPAASLQPASHTQKPLCSRCRGLLCGLWGDLHRTRISRSDGRRVPGLGWSAVNWPPVSR